MSEAEDFAGSIVNRETERIEDIPEIAFDPFAGFVKMEVHVSADVANRLVYYASQHHIDPEDSPVSEALDGWLRARGY